MDVYLSYPIEPVPEIKLSGGFAHSATINIHLFG